MDHPEFQCLKCASKPTFCTLGESALHQKIHISDKNFQFTCLLSTCGLKFLSYNALDVHISRDHKQFRHVPVISRSLQCSVPNCEKEFPSSKLLCHHLSSEHHAKGTATQCPFKDRCKSNYYFSSTFGVHLSQYHKGWRTSFGVPNPLSGPVASTASDIGMDYTADGDMSDNFMDVEDDSSVGPMSENVTHHSENSCESDLTQMKNEFYHSLAMFYLRLESECHLPVTTVQTISKGLEQLTEASLLILRKATVRELKDLNLSEEEKERSLNNILSADCLYAGHHKDVLGPSMTTNDLRKSYFKSHFKYVEPKEINLSRDPNQRRCVYYVPVEETLNLVLSNPEIEEEVEASFSQQCADGIIRDYKDGSLYRERRREINENTIDLLIFQDAFTPTKDLSSVANSYQILGMYMTIGNLRPHLRSKLNCMQLVLLIPEFKEMFADFKLDCFKKVVSDLKSLQVEGIEFKGQKIRVQLQFLIGDNKGQHEIGGFIQSFSHEYFCRYCTMTKSEINEEPWKVGPLRTPESYEQAAVSVAANRSTFMGVSGPELKCPFNELQNFHVCDPSLAPCLGHDLFEGVIVYDLSLIIKYLVTEKKWFTYEILNRSIKQFKYIGHDSSNKPAPIRHDKKNKGKQKKNDDKNQQKQKKTDPTLGGHAVQNWTFLRLLPFIVGDELIKDPEDEYWKLYLLLKQITELLCAPSITLAQLSLLKVLTEDYAVKRQELLGDGKPKHHYFAHYPDLIEIMGPLFHLFTLRFENFHQFFKRVARKCNNYINIGITMVTQYSLYLSYLSSGSPFIKGIKITDEGIPIAHKLTAIHDDSLISAVNSMGITDQALVMKSIVVDENLYREGNWILIRNFDDSSIVIAQVQFIIMNANAVFLLLKEHVANLEQRAGIYVVQSEVSDISCVSIKDLKYPSPQSVYKWGEHEICFSLKHSLAY